MYIRNSSEPSTDPWGTPARIDLQEKQTILVLLFVVYYLNSYLSIGVSSMPFCLNLNSRPWCHTLLKAFDISQKTIQENKLLSKD